MFEYHGNIHVYCPGVGADEPLGSIFFQNHLYSVLLPISCKTFSLNDILKANALATYVDLAVKKGQGHHMVMICIYIVVLEPSILHAKFL